LNAENEDYTTRIELEFREIGCPEGYRLFICVEDEDEAKENLKEACQNLIDQIGGANALATSEINTAIKNEITELRNSIKKAQEERNRSIVLEILATHDNFKQAVHEIFDTWRSEDANK
jgi:molecular chaperone GrpE (heat shock protein)